MPSPPIPPVSPPINTSTDATAPRLPFLFPSTSFQRTLNPISSDPNTRAPSPIPPATSDGLAPPYNTTRRRSFNVSTANSLAPFPPQPRARTKTAPSPNPRMMTTMNMAHRLAGGRVKDQTIHHSFSDRSSTHTKPAPAQDAKLGYTADGLKRISNSLGTNTVEGKVAPCVSPDVGVVLISRLGNRLLYLS